MKKVLFFSIFVWVLLTSCAEQMPSVSETGVTLPTATHVPTKTLVPTITFTPNPTTQYEGTLSANQTQNAGYGLTQTVKQTDIAQTQAVKALTPSDTPTITITPTPTVFFTPTPNPVTGLIVTFGEDVNSPWNSGILAFSPDGTLIAMTGENIRIWNVYTHELMYVFTETHLNCTQAQIAFSPDGNLLAVSSYYCRDDEHPGYLNIYDLSRTTFIQEWVLENAKMYEPYHSDYLISVNAFAFLPNGTKIAFASGNTIEIRDIYESTEPVILELGTEMYASEISVTEGGGLLFVLMDWYKWNTFPSMYKNEFGIQIWNLQTFSINEEIDYPEIEPSAEYMSLYGEWVSHIFYDDAKFEMENLITGQIKPFPFRMGWRYLSEDRNYIVFARFAGFNEKDHQIEVWNTDTWRNLYTFNPRFGSDWFYGLDDIVFSPDNKILAISHEEQLSLWNIEPVIYP